ncbi:MAG: sterol desaturase family protein [Yoonia sp.]|nr:sterol desaturase family protein [Yoonia sp.]
MGLENEFVIRLGVFLGLFVVLALVERVLPRRQMDRAKARRWLTNWAMSFVNILALRLVALALPFLAIGAALDAQANGFGVLNSFDVPNWIAWGTTILALDFAIWAQHVVTHKIPVLWRLHQVHHADTEMDVTTAIRFHPVEIAFSMTLKVGLIYLLGPPAAAVLLFEILLNGSAMFNHANIRLPLWLDTVLRRVIVTPDMHRVHHSTDRQEHDSNYGFFLSIWDHLFATHVPQPKLPHETMPIGLRWQDRRPSGLAWSLLLPFRNPKKRDLNKP